jgi:uncharacterized protein (TIGR00645 family)
MVRQLESAASVKPLSPPHTPDEQRALDARLCPPTAIIGISSIHLLRTFINAASYDTKVLMWQTLIHITFLLSALAIALTDRVMGNAQPAQH